MKILVTAFQHLTTAHGSRLRPPCPGYWNIFVPDDPTQQVFVRCARCNEGYRFELPTVVQAPGDGELR